MDQLTIGQMAKINNVSEKTLRYYQELGLLEPRRVDKQSGYRYYSVDQCLVVDMIQRLQHLGFSLREISALASHQDVGELLEALEGRRGALEEERRQLDRQFSLIDSLQANCRLFLSRPVLYQPMFVQRPPMSVIVLPDEEYALSDTPCHAQVTVQDWSLTTRALKQAIAAHGWSETLFRDVGIVIPERDGGYSKDDCLLSIVVDEVPPEAQSFAISYPEGPCVMMYYSQDYYSGNTVAVDLLPGEDLDLALIRKLREYACSAGVRTKGDYLCETLIDSLAKLFESGSELYRVSIPIEEGKGIPW